MHINRLEFTDFKAIQSVDINFYGKSSIIFGINGTGKSTILRSVNLLYANIINQIVNRKELKQYYAIQLEDIRYRAKETQIRAEFDINGENIEYGRRMVRSTGKKYENKDGIKKYVISFMMSMFQMKYREIYLYLLIMVLTDLYWIFL